MSSYYTELDDALGADEEADRYMREHEKETKRKKRTFESAVKIELSKMEKITPIKSKNIIRGKTVEVKCKCGVNFIARIADRKRGWGKYCSKSCKAKNCSNGMKTYSRR